MKGKITTAIALLFSATSFAQINMADSTVKTIAYWDKNEKQEYSITADKFKLKGADTISRENIKYEIQITVLDSTANSYTIEWFYKNFSINTDNAFKKKIASITQDMKVVFKTDEVGGFVEVVNWKEVRDYIKKMTDGIKNEFSDKPEMVKIINHIAATFSTKESIESVSTKDIRQFHTFHGSQYKLSEVLKGQQKVPNIYGTEPFDSYSSLYLDEINDKDNNYILRASQSIDEKQLLDATFNYLTKLAQSMKVDPPKREDIKEMKNETLTSSRIHGSGWVIYSVQTTTVTADNSTNIEERVIEIK